MTVAPAIGVILRQHGGLCRKFRNGMQLVEKCAQQINGRFRITRSSSSSVASTSWTEIENSQVPLTITAVGAGACTVTVRCYKDSSKQVLYDTKTISVTVSSSGTSKPYLILSDDSVQIDMSSSKKAKVSLSIGNSNGNGHITGQISDLEVADFDFGSWSNGVVPINITAKERGSCTITLKLYEDSSKEVLHDTKIISVTVKNDKLYAYATMQYKDSKRIDFDDFNEVSFMSRNESVVRVNNNGIVTAVGKGTGIIVVKDDKGRVCDLEITVEYAWWQWLIKIILFGWIWY